MFFCLQLISIFLYFNYYFCDFIEEEIDSKSQDSQRNDSKPLNLIRNSGPHEIPSDSNPYNRRNANDESSEITGTPISRPPKAPSKMHSKNMYKSPAHQIFKTSKQREKEQNKDELPLSKQNSEPPKQTTNPFSGKYEEERKIDNLLDSDVNNEVQGASSSLHNNYKSDVESVLLKIRSEYTKESLLKCPIKSPIKELVKYEDALSEDED